MNLPADYIDVAERIRLFKEQYPEGSLQGHMTGLETVGDKTFVVYRAYAYRTADDMRPGVGWAWEPVPGPTPFTRDSELMNAETSAWGRAIVALGMPTKKIASSDEVRNRQQASEQETPANDGRGEPEKSGEFDYEPDPVNVLRGRLVVILKRLNEQVPRQERPEGTSWAEELQAWMYENYGKTESKDLEAGELEALVNHANGLLHAEGVETVS